MAKVPRHEIAEVLAEQSFGRINAHEFSEQIAAYLIDTRRTADLEPLLRDIMQYRADKGIVEVIAVTARPLAASARQDVEVRVKTAYPKAQHIIISEEVKPELVGGVRLEFPNQQLDVSVRAKLNRFKQLTTAGK